jgi:FixJ family two-component response regulator
MSPSAHISEVPLVLIVDDDVSVRRSTERLIRSLGMRAESFASARHLLSSEDSIEADCLLIDIRMPGIDGLQLLRRLRANSQRTQVAIHLTQLAKSAKRSAVLQERNRLAGEIHDSLAQSFASSL